MDLEQPRNIRTHSIVARRDFNLLLSVLRKQKNSYIAWDLVPNSYIKIIIVQVSLTGKHVIQYHKFHLP